MRAQSPQKDIKSRPFLVKESLADSKTLLQQLEAHLGLNLDK